ncbi:response regulator [Thiorhodococcus mannitoliphagus]|uniref:Response regulator n=1 Tax=Thiorhodococcus mannitoliphagus TaxID=329406 RepID=A0A6P1DRC6_9GAMM|nr:response regulator [Thiorhodococcus mannitoliphagus]NEX20439.1 response regulator [Thiorhodococcus mannitoliphagus]
MKILLVDDSKSARYALRLQLQRHGVEVDTAESAEAAFVKLKGALPDAIFMDHMMPGLNGFEALEVIREDSHTSNIPVVMCTSHEEPEFVAQAKKKGVFGILPKSAAPELLPEMLEKLQSALGVSTAAPEPAAPTTSKVEAAAGLSDEAIIKIVDGRLEARLSKILPALIEELRRDLSEGILNETQRILDERAAAEQAAKRKAAPQPSMADLQAISTRIATETVPDLIKRGLQAERTQIMEIVDKRLRDALPKTGSGHNAAQEGEDIAAKAVAMARRESQEAIDTALATSRESIQAVELSLQKAKGTIFGLIALAAILGIGAAGAVFVLLGGG